MKCKKCRKDIPADSVFCLYCGKKQQTQSKKTAGRTRPNGTGTAYKRGKTWTASVVIGWKTIEKNNDKKKRVPVKRTKGGFATKAEAINYLPQLICGNVVSSRTTIASLYEGYRDGPMTKLSKSKQTAYKIAYSKWDDIAYIDLSTLKIEDLQRQVNSKAPTFYPARDMKNLLSHLYKRALAQQDAKVNLAAFIELPELNEGERNPFSEDEIKTLWKDWKKGNLFTGYILLMAYSGMMPGELFLLQKSMINWDDQTIFGCGLKTKKRKITPIVIADVIIPVLKTMCKTLEGEKFLPMSEDDFYEKFKETMKRCKFKVEHKPYDCRHSTATALALANVSPPVIKEVMRHSKFSTTERYIHVDASPMLQAVNEIKSKK